MEYLCFASGFFAVFFLSAHLASRFGQKACRNEREAAATGLTGGTCLACLLMSVLLMKDVTAQRYAFLYGMAAGSLYFACRTDLSCCEVYDFCWVFMIIALFVPWMESGHSPGRLFSLSFFWLLQQTFLSRFYGRADSHAFCVCAMFFYLMGADAEAYLKHMILSFSLLILHQAGRKNIGKDARLIRPTAFVPYITAAFFVNILQLPV